MRKFSLVIIVLTLTVVIFEIFLRYSPFSYGITPMTYDKDIGMWHKKNFSADIIKECYKTRYSFGEEGRISNSYEYNKNKKDIILLGDSQVEALMVTNYKVMHNSLYKELNGKYNILNYGLSGTGPSQQLEILKNKVNLKNIDTLVHFVFLENDLNDGDPKNFNKTNRPKVYTKFRNLTDYEIIKPRDYDTKEKIRDFLGHFELYVYLKKTFYFYNDFISTIFTNKKHLIKDAQYDENKYKINNEEYKWKQLKGSIYQINKIVKENNFNYKIIIFSIFEIDGYTKYREEFESFLNQQNIKYGNITPILNSLRKKQQIDFDCDVHWNGKTHQNIAKYLSIELKF